MYVHMAGTYVKYIASPVHCYLSQAQRHVVCGDYPCTEDQAIYLAGINLQVSWCGCVLSLLWGVPPLMWVCHVWCGCVISTGGCTIKCGCVMSGVGVSSLLRGVPSLMWVCNVYLGVGGPITTVVMSCTQCTMQITQGDFNEAIHRAGNFL